jgi:hypothetical protein
MHNSRDFISSLNEQVYKSALWEHGLQIEYWQFNGPHQIDDPGKTAAFEKAMQFIVGAFSNPIPKPASWSHYDLYPEFDVWDYQVRSDKKEPGFIYLKNVSQSGFGIQTHRWLPVGPPLNPCKIELTTAALYQPNTAFNVISCGENDDLLTETVKSDPAGRLHLTRDQRSTETGIYRKGDAPDLISLGYEVGNKTRFIRAGKENKVSLRVLNRGGDIDLPTSGQVVLTPLDSSTTVQTKSVAFELRAGQRVATLPPFGVHCSMKPPASLEPPWVKFKIIVSLGAHSYEDEVMIPVFFDVPDFKGIKVDDGRTIRDRAFGSGNGNGIASPGESIMIYIDGRRARLYADDPFVLTGDENLFDEILPGTAGDGYTLSSIVKISNQCPAGHVIEFLANFETKTLYPKEPIERKLTWGRVMVTVR